MPAPRAGARRPRPRRWTPTWLLALGGAAAAGLHHRGEPAAACRPLPPRAAAEGGPCAAAGRGTPARQRGVADSTRRLGGACRAEALAVRREAGLRAEQETLEVSAGSSWKLAEAVEHRDELLGSGRWGPAQLGLFAEEVSHGGARRFFVDTYAGFSLRVASQFGGHLYEVIQEGRPCWLYFDLEFPKHSNPGLDTDHVMRQFRQALADFCTKVELPYDESLTVVQDSSTEAKFSAHVIVKSLAFPDNVQVGVFVQAFLAYARESKDSSSASGISTDLLFIRKDLEDHQETKSIVDTSVYTKNRCFRVLYQSKYGKNVTLTLQDGAKVVHESDLPACQVLRTLVSFVPEGTAVRENTNIPDFMEHLAHLQSVREPSRCVDVDAEMQPLIHWLIEKWDDERRESEQNVAAQLPTAVENVKTVRNGRSVVYEVTLANNRFCLQRGRSHKRNAIFLRVDAKRGVFEQRCVDHVDCPNKLRWKSRREFPIPINLLPVP